MSFPMANGRVILITNKGYTAALHTATISPFSDGNFVYRSFLHAYYPYFVANDPDWMWEIQNSKTVEHARLSLGVDKLLEGGSVYKHNSRYNIEETYTLIKSIMCLRLLADKHMRTVLMSTAGAQLMMCNNNDNVLGVGRAWLGLNLAGQALMEVRDFYISRGGLNAPEFQN